MSTNELRKNYLIEELMTDNELKLVYTHYDRMIIGGAKPVGSAIKLKNHPELRAEYFLERREMGIINVGGNGVVEADGNSYSLAKMDCLYLAKGAKQVTFKSTDAGAPALYYILSAPAHHSYENRLMKKEEASPVKMGELKTANQRTIYKYIHLEGIKSCQLVMGLTTLQEGSVWNTMPAHIHTRRMEAYFYFDVPSNQRVIHFMGEPTESRHLVVANNQAIISPPWSIHSGSGTSNYSFIWGMAGENLNYADMDAVSIEELR